MSIPSINNLQDLELTKGIRVLLRCDLNLPQDEKGEFTDLFRLESSLPTISYLLDRGATIFITSHLGSPKGQIDPALSLKKVATLLSSQLGRDVHFITDPFDESLNLSQKDGIFLVENLRFWPGEETDLSRFATDLVSSTSAEIFVQDAFGVCHRNHASLTKIPKLLPSYSGLLLQKEIEFLSVPEPDNLNLIIGGAKVESKLPVIENFIDKAGSILTGGIVANTFLKATGQEISASLHSQETLGLAKQVLGNISASNTELLLPTDYSVSESPDSKAAIEADAKSLNAKQMILDLGPETISKYKSSLQKSKTIIWAGTLGFAENLVFAKASEAILNHLIGLKIRNNDLKIIIGGGDTVDFVRSALDDTKLALIDHLSTGGGASLLMLGGQELPGIKALQTSSNSSIIPPASKDTSTTVLSPVLIANLKSNFNITQLNLWLEELLVSDRLNLAKLNLSLAVPSLFIEEVSSKLHATEASSIIKIIAQDISSYEEGAHTGEVAASMLKGIASGVMIGHSERRFGAGEDLGLISKKIERAVNAELEVILCVGSKSKDLNTHKVEVYDQLCSALVKFNSQNSGLLTVAYEPVFAIGTGDIPTDQFLIDQLESIRLILQDSKFSSRVLYGGSVNTSNSKSILGLGFDGLLVGSASLKVPNLEDIGINIQA